MSTSVPVVIAVVLIGPPRVMALPPSVNAPPVTLLVLVKAMAAAGVVPLIKVRPVMSLLVIRLVLPAKIKASLLTGAVPAQLVPVLQFASPPPPLQVS